MNLEDWRDDDEVEGLKVRNLTFTVSVNLAILTKDSPNRESQRLYPESRRGERYLVDADVFSKGVPYAHTFYTTVRYCLKAVSKNCTSLVITGKVKHNSSSSYISRAIIDKSAKTVLMEGFVDFMNVLKNEISPSSPSRRNSPSLRSSYSLPNGTKNLRAEFRERKSYSESSCSEDSDSNSSFLVPYLLKTITLLLLGLSLFNVYLYRQVSNLEYIMQTFLEYGERKNYLYLKNNL
ncbi:hypothetical protein HELRODRAFT_187962 [Helobdella robusta]|uniref:VASt domain-containing protein n=1 Tax=Helobdella robusta TaxID=6412 RepID=T1FPI4_HELRO|nr:hypothetical protein HELRODRAFT_187962 [Helobdella robusta]ESO12729.1 hypothetical protein HELRODRAFT_187962 [Helobdella robusta]